MHTGWSSFSLQMREVSEALGHQRLQAWPPASLPALKAAEMCVQPSWMVGLICAYMRFSEVRSCQGSPDAMSRNGSQAADGIRSVTSILLALGSVSVSDAGSSAASPKPDARPRLLEATPAKSAGPSWEGVKTRHPPPPPRPKASRLPGQ